MDRKDYPSSLSELSSSSRFFSVKYRARKDRAIAGIKIVPMSNNKEPAVRPLEAPGVWVVPLARAAVKVDGITLPLNPGDVEYGFEVDKTPGTITSVSPASTPRIKLIPVLALPSSLIVSPFSRRLHYYRCIGRA